jgi:hypothetical protein
MREIEVMLVGIAGRHDAFDVAADHLPRAVAKQRLTGLVEGQDGPAFVDDDDPVDGRIEHAGEPRLGDQAAMCISCRYRIVSAMLRAILQCPDVSHKRFPDPRNSLSGIRS